MTETPFAIIFYVTDAAKSCTFYTRLLEREPAEAVPNGLAPST